MKLNIYNLPKNINKKKLMQVFFNRLQKEEVADKVEVDLKFCSKKEIITLNKKYLNRDGATDVLSFPIFKKNQMKKIISEQPILLGEIVICPSQAKNHSIEFLLDHGLKHLLGKHHK